MSVEVIVLGVFFLLILLVFAPRYRRCPPGRLLVVYGKYVRGAALVTDRARLVLPIVQDYAYLPLEPIDVCDPETGSPLLSVRINRDPERALRAAIRFLDLPEAEIARMVIEALSKLEERDDVRAELDKMGLELVERSG